MELSTIIQQIAVLNNQQTQQAEQVSGLMAGASKEAAGVATNLEQAGAMAADAELTALQGQLNTQNARVKAANAFGTNVNAQSDVITNFAQMMRQDAIKLVEAQDNVSRIEAGSDLLGNPMGWLEDLLMGDGARAERDALADSFSTKHKLVTDLNSATQTTVATQNAISETLTQKSIKDLSQLKALKANNEAAEARINSARYGVASIEALQQLGEKNFNRNMAGYNAIQADEQWRAARADRLAAQKEKKADEASLDEMLQSVNTYRQTFGMRPVDAAYVKRNWNDQEFRRNINSQEQAGWRIVDNGGSTEGVLGSKPSDSFGVIASGELTLPPSWKPSLSILDAANQKLQQEVALIGTVKDQMNQDAPTPMLGLTKENRKDPAVMQAAFNKAADQIARDAQSLIKHGQGNPYQVPPVSNIFESPTRGAAALRESKFGRDVLGSIVQTGVPDPAPELVIATALNLMDKGEITLKEVNDGLGLYLDVGVGVVNATGGFSTTNVLGTNSYNVSLTDLAGQKPKILNNTYAGWTSLTGIAIDAAFGKQPLIAEKEVFNLLDPQDRTTVLTILASRKRAGQLEQAMKGNQP